MKFLHAADLHIDSPLLGLEKSEEAPVDEIRSAPRDAFRRLVRLAHDENVDFVILAGDIFDGEWHDMRTGLFFNAQLKALGSIRVYITCGNHDAETDILKRLTLPQNTYMFGSRHAETKTLADIGVAIHGQSYRQRAVLDDLSAGYPKAIAGLTNVGVLHTSLGGYAGHEPYAPCSLQALVNFGYDYWALGHIHTRTIVHRNPLIAYSGNLQGRHIRETGPKGCYIVAGERDSLTETFHPLDVVRWFNERVDVSAAGNADDALGIALKHIHALRAKNGGTLLCLRIELVGATNAHRVLTAAQATYEADIRSQISPEMWLAELRIGTSPVIDLAAVRQQDDLQGALFRSIDLLRVHPENNPKLQTVIKPLKIKLPSQVVDKYYTQLDNPEFLVNALDGAERILLAAMGC